MTALILKGATIICACDHVDAEANQRFAIVNGGAIGVYPADGGLTVVDDVTLPAVWPGDGYSYADGVFTALPPAPGPVPESVSNFQGRAILAQLGIDADVQAAIAAIPDVTQRAIAQLAYDKAEFGRNSPLLISVATGLGKDAAFIDEMFRQAALIKI